MRSRVEPTVLADRYELGDVLGRGGMAVVCRAHDRRLGRTVAVKMMRADLVDRADFVARFGKEARSAAALNHPTIVAVYDSGETRLRREWSALDDVMPDDTKQYDTVQYDTAQYDTVPYIVMEYVQGRTLSQLLDEGPVPVDRALSVTTGVLTALEQVHAAGIVHRDIKPSNVMLTASGAVKVMDFGIARALEDSTVTTNLVASPHYMSPEHAHGERVDARSDLYSVGCVLFELLTGRPPFDAQTPLAVVLAQLNASPPRPSLLRPDVPPALDRVVAKALAKARSDRYQTAAQLRADLEAVVRGDEPVGLVVAPAAAAPAVRARPRRVGRVVGRRWLVAALALVGLAVLVVGGARWWSREEAVASAGPGAVAQGPDVGQPAQAQTEAAGQPTTGTDDETVVPPAPGPGPVAGSVGPVDPGGGQPPGSRVTWEEAFEAEFAPPDAGPPSRQVQAPAGNDTQPMTVLSYQSSRSLDALVTHYQTVLADDGRAGAYFFDDKTPSSWAVYPTLDDRPVSVTLTRNGSGTSVVVTYRGAAG